MAVAQKVREIMTPDPVTVQADQTIVEAARLMKQNDVGPVLVLDAGQVSGIVTDRDIAVRAVAKGKNPNQVRVEEVATKNIRAVSPDDEADDAVQMMRENAVRRLPVIKGAKPIGIVSLGDLALKKDPKSALAGISGAPPNN
jgi:CBS domain-containing protein